MKCTDNMYIRLSYSRTHSYTAPISVSTSVVMIFNVLSRITSRKPVIWSLLPFRIFPWLSPPLTIYYKHKCTTSSLTVVHWWRCHTRGSWMFFPDTMCTSHHTGLRGNVGLNSRKTCSHKNVSTSRLLWPLKWPINSLKYFFFFRFGKQHRHIKFKY